MIVRKILNGLSYATLFVAWGFMGTSIYWAFFDKATPIYYTKMITPPTIETTVGSTVDIKYDVIRTRACHLSFTRYLEDERDSASEITPIFVIEQGEREVLGDQVGDPVDVNIPLVITPNIKPSTYVFYTRLSFACNPMQRFFPLVIDSPKTRIIVKPKE